MADFQSPSSEAYRKNKKKKKIAKIASIAVAALGAAGVSTGFITPEFITAIFAL